MSKFIEFDDDEPYSPVCWCGGCEEDPCSIYQHENRAYSFGVAVAFGLMGMAEAIRERLFEEAWGESCASSYETNA
jgi:hypothetical protein